MSNKFTSAIQPHRLAVSLGVLALLLAAGSIFVYLNIMELKTVFIIIVAIEIAVLQAAMMVRKRPDRRLERDRDD